MERFLRPTQLLRRNPARRIAFILHLCVCVRPFWKPTAYLSGRCQLRAVIGDEHEQARRLFCAHILTDEMATSGRLKEAFTGLVDFERSGRGIFGTDRPRGT